MVLSSSLGGETVQTLNRTPHGRLCKEQNRGGPSQSGYCKGRSWRLYLEEGGWQWVKRFYFLVCISDHTIERSVRMFNGERTTRRVLPYLTLGWRHRCLQPKVKYAFDKGMKVVTFFKSSTIGGNDLAKLQEELHDHPLVFLCSTHRRQT